ncbi:MAG: ATP-binding protein [Synergistaceae bacterium]|nr:ATP-binding protein [Synergistaceae bacterium]
MTKETRADNKSERGASQKNQPPLMSRFILFSVTLFTIILVAGSAAFILSMRQIIRTNKGIELSQLVEIERIKLETSVNNEIAIALKMSDSPLIQRYFANPYNPGLERMAFEELAAYRNAFTNKSIFWINDIDRKFYSDDYEPFIVDPEKADNYWYNMTFYETETYNFNINYNPDLKVTNLWINVPVFDKNRIPIGIVGTGIELSAFINTLYKSYKDNSSVELYFFNTSGEITGSKNVELVAMKKNIEEELGKSGRGIIANAIKLNPGETKTLDTPLGRIALGTVPLLEWYSVAFLPDSIDDYKTSMTVFLIVAILLIAALFIIFNVFIAGLLNPLRKTMIDLEAASKSKSEFLAVMSHEIRTPMNVIIGVAQIQLQKETLSAEYKEELKKIYSSANNLLGIINDILDMSKIETGKLELHLAEYDIPNLINDTVQINVVRIGAKPIEFKLDIDENLPSQLYGDELRIKQILNNLLSNAIKYTGKGYVKLSINHSVEDENIKLRFAIEDTGQGIKFEDQKRLFSAYSRFNAEANRTTEGTGLGLSITKNLVDLMDGTIDIESEYGKGSIFTATVKQKAVPCEAVGAELAKQLENFTFTSDMQIEKLQVIHEPMPYGKVLIVDDVETNSYVAKGLMSPYKLTVETVLSGFEAIDIVESGKTFDIIFMDHMMPKMDGIETTQKLRRLGYEGVIVALTANALVGNAGMFLQNGFDSFISKPIDIRRLDAILIRFIRDRHPEEAGKLKPQTAVQAVEVDAKLLEIFVQDAQKAIVSLMEAVANGDMKQFTIIVHGIKSALANIGESEKSAAALALEKAGLSGDKEFISANIENFTGALEALISDLNPEKTADDDNTDISENTAYLTEQLQVIKDACESYNILVALAALKLLEEKQWKPKTTAVLKRIHNMLFLHSDFESVAEQIEAILGTSQSE